MTLFDPHPEPAPETVEPTTASGAPDGVLDLVVVSFDGGSRGNPGPAAIGAVVTDGDGRVLATVSERIGETTNNVAEYRALIAGLVAARAFPTRRLLVRGDSMLVIQQVGGAWKVKQPHLRPFVSEARALVDEWPDHELTHVRREQNADADLLVNAALDAG